MWSRAALFAVAVLAAAVGVSATAVPHGPEPPTTDSASVDASSWLWQTNPVDVDAPAGPISGAVTGSLSPAIGHRLAGTAAAQALPITITEAWSMARNLAAIDAGLRPVWGHGCDAECARGLTEFLAQHRQRAFALPRLVHLSRARDDVVLSILSAVRAARAERGTAMRAVLLGAGPLASMPRRVVSDAGFSHVTVTDARPLTVAAARHVLGIPQPWDSALPAPSDDNSSWAAAAVLDVEAPPWRVLPKPAPGNSDSTWGPFDAVVMSDVLHLLQDTEAGLTTAFDLADPARGVVIIETATAQRAAGTLLDAPAYRDNPILSVRHSASLPSAHTVRQHMLRKFAYVYEVSADALPRHLAYGRVSAAGGVVDHQLRVILVASHVALASDSSLLARITSPGEAPRVTASARSSREHEAPTWPRLFGGVASGGPRTPLAAVELGAGHAQIHAARPRPRRRVLVTYASQGSAGSFARSAERLRRSAIEVGGFDDAVVFSPANLTARFNETFARHMREPRGAGLWAWKTEVLLAAMGFSDEPEASRLVSNGDVLMYSDAGSLVTGPLQPLVDALDECVAAPVVAFALPFRERMFTTHDTLIALGETGGHVGDRLQLAGGSLLLRVGDAARALVREWRRLMAHDVLLRESPSVVGPDPPGFVQHRHDQSLFSILARRGGACELPAPWDDSDAVPLRWHVSSD